MVLDCIDSLSLLSFLLWKQFLEIQIDQSLSKYFITKNCFNLVADLFLFYYETDFILSLSEVI